ncbi:STAS domain-containing protein [Actinomycetes bacterium M1A6_2h]
MIEFDTTTTPDNIGIVTPRGRLNMVAAPRLREIVADLVADGVSRVVVDLDQTEFMDSSGLGALISGLKSTRLAGGDLRIARPTAQIESVLALTNLNRVLRSSDSVEGAFGAR